MSAPDLGLYFLPLWLVRLLPTVVCIVAGQGKRANTLKAQESLGPLKGRLWGVNKGRLDPSCRVERHCSRWPRGC